MNRERELEDLRAKAQRLERDVEQHRDALAAASDDPRLVASLKRSSAVAMASDCGDADPSASDLDEDEHDAAQQVLLDKLRASGDELARQRRKLDQQLAMLRAAQQDADRSQPSAITLANLHAQDMSQYFVQFGDSQVDHGAMLPAAFVTQCMGSGMQTPGAVRAADATESPDAQQRRLHAQQQQLKAAMSVTFESIDSLSRCIQAYEKAGNFTVPPSEKVTAPRMAAQMMTPVGSMKPCVGGRNCLALTTLPPHSNGMRMPLKQWQATLTFNTFTNTSVWMESGSMANVTGKCLPCILMGWAQRAMAAMQMNQPCSAIAFPLDVVVERPDGFRRSAIVASDTMPVAHPNLAPHHFVPVEREYVHWSLDRRTGQKIRHADRVFGYEFRSDVLFDPATYSCGTDQFEQVPMRASLITTTHEVQEPPLPGVLVDNVRHALSIEIAQSKQLGEVIKHLLVEFEATVRLAMASDVDVGEACRANMAHYWNNSWMQAPEDVLRNPHQWTPRSHSVLTACMWRVGLCLWLQSRPEISGNTNLNAFLNAHTPLQKWLFSEWVRLGEPPSDKQLFAEDLAVLTPEGVCAVLSIRQLYPTYAVAYLSPAHQREVRVKIVHHRRTPPIEVVRRAVLPKQLLASATDHSRAPRALLRATLAYLVELWTGDGALRAAVVSVGWRLANDTDSPDTDLALLHSSPEVLKQWIAKAISLIALQTTFEDSIWLLGAIVERWTWFQRAAAAQSSATVLGAMEDDEAAEALVMGHWMPRDFDPAVEIGTPARVATLPHDTPTWVKSLRGWRRFAAAYDRCTADAELIETVNVGEYLYPEALINFTNPDSRHRCYLTLGALRLRVYELQRLAAKYDEPLRAAFDKTQHAARAEAREAAEPLRHERRNVSTRIRAAVQGTDAGAQPLSLEFPTPLSSGASVMDAAEKLTARWPAPDNTVREALDVNVTLTESIAETLLGPLMRGEQAKTRVTCMGVPPDARGTDDLAYNVRCALFECLELAHQATAVDDASDSHWLFAQDDSPLRPLDMHAPLSGTAACEDTLPDISAWVGLDLLHEAGRADFTSDIQARRSWIPQVTMAMHKACYIRDFAANHAQNCRHSEYAAAMSRVLLTSVQGTYRHACTTQRFDRVLRMYASLRPHNSHSHEGREVLARYLVHNTYKTLVAVREFQMMSILAAVSQRDVIAAAWSNFAYVQRCWVPQQAERMRELVRGARSETTSERRTRDLVRDEEEMDRANDEVAAQQHGADKLIPRVFRHLPPSWPYQMLTMFCRAENERHTDAKVRSVGRAGASDDGGISSLLPPIVNMVPPTLKHLMVRYFSQTDPRGPIRLQWFADCGVSSRGLAQLVWINALYTAQERPVWQRAVMAQMDRVDFVYAWTALHVMVLHRDSQVLPMTWDTAQRQYLAAQFRVADMANPPPRVFTHMRFCHPLGCPGAQSYHVPFADNGHYGAQEDMTAIDLGRITCGRHKSTHMFDKLVRRVNETPVTEMSDSLGAIMAALDECDDPAQRRALEADLVKLRDKLTTHQATNVRATISVMMTRPCNEAPAQELRVVGAMVVRYNSIHARERPRVYTACPNCAMPTIYSMDRIGPNGFMCGQCNREARWAEHGKWCVSCGLVEQAVQLPTLTGEAEAEARAGRTEHQIQGSTQQARSLKAHLTRARHDTQVKRQAAMGSKPDDESDVLADDSSDVLSVPMKSHELQAAVDRRNARKTKRPITERRRNTASELKLGRSLSTVHPMALKMRMEPFVMRVVYDDRQGGAFVPMAASICGPCENRIRVSTLSLDNILMQTHAPPDEIWVYGARVQLNGRRAMPRPRWRFRGRRLTPEEEKRRADYEKKRQERKKSGTMTLLSADDSLQFAAKHITD